MNPLPDSELVGVTGDPLTTATHCSTDLDGPIAMGQVVAVEFRTIAMADDHRRI
jgi:hypothetical protein